MLSVEHGHCLPCWILPTLQIVWIPHPSWLGSPLYSCHNDSLELVSMPFLNGVPDRRAVLPWMPTGFHSAHLGTLLQRASLIDTKSQAMAVTCDTNFYPQLSFSCSLLPLPNTVPIFPSGNIFALLMICFCSFMDFKKYAEVNDH